jgi:AhpD family alkylhydroperoxidase
LSGVNARLSQPVSLPVDDTATREPAMEQDWKNANHLLGQAISDYRHAAPEVAAAFSGIAQSATKPGALDPKTKELIALAIGIAGRCDGCVGFHTQAAIRHGASRDEVVDAIGVAIYMGGGPSYVYGAQALQAFDQLSR